jgi:DNA-binding response OmpR family regulator
MDRNIHILVVEDDGDINRLLCQIIEDAGYTSQPAFSGTEALIHFEKQTWDLVLLDLMLPGKSGEELLSILRKESDVAIIVISAKEERFTKIDMLRGGADDYITKPFDNEEVAVRIEAQLRRYRRAERDSQLIFKDIQLDQEAKSVRVNDTNITLTALEYKIMLLFLVSPKKVFTKENIFESVWGIDYHGDENVVNVHMSNLRTKLSQANPGVEYIETMWGIGYRLKT